VSVDAVVSRIAQLQSLMAPPQAAPTANFAASLASASAPTATAAATAATPAATLATTASTGPSALPTGTPYGAEITAAAERNGLDPALLAGLIKQESGFNPNAGSPAGAQGLCQLMPGTARGLGVTDLHDPAQSIEGGAKYLAQQLKTFNGDVARALAAYNAGPGAVQRYGGVPPYAETQAYVHKVQAFAAAYRGTPSSLPYPTA
jgi:soluble lytic murein transglycosylase-like protein